MNKRNKSVHKCLFEYIGELQKYKSILFYTTLKYFKLKLIKFLMRSFYNK